MKVIYHYPKYEVIGMLKPIHQLCQSLRAGHEHGLRDVVRNHREFHEGALAVIAAVEKELKKENIMKFFTHTGSTYEVDQDKHLIRRTPQEGNPTKTKEDNAWREYALHTPIEMGKSVLIWWNSNDLQLVPYTTTSFITGIQ